RGAERGNHRDATANKLGGQRRQLVVAAVGPTIIHRDVAAFDEAGLCKPAAEPLDEVRRSAGRTGVEESDHRTRLLLRARRQRPCRRRGAEEREEGAAVHRVSSGHSTTRSARRWNEGGNSMPSALAVLRLIANSNLTGWMTGRSAGFSPLRM